MQKRINPECQEERQGFTRLLTTYHTTLALVGSVVKNKGKPVRAIGQGVIRWIKERNVTSAYVKYIGYRRNKKEITLWLHALQDVMFHYEQPKFQVGGIWLSCILNQVKSVHDILDFERIFQSKGITKKNGHFHLSTIWKQTKHIKECILFSSE